MKTLSQYKAAYKRAKRSETRNKAFNSAMLNLDYYEQKEFLKWQLSL